MWNKRTTCSLLAVLFWILGVFAILQRFYGSPYNFVVDSGEHHVLAGCGTIGIGVAFAYLARRKRPPGNVPAAILSFIIPGLGQLYQRRVGMGVFLFVAALMPWVRKFGVGEWIISILACIDAAVWKGRR